MNYFIAAVMLIGLLMMVNIDRFKTQHTNIILNSNTAEAPIKTQEKSLEPQETILVSPSLKTIDEQTTNEIYKCKNSKGGVIYSELKCPSNTTGSQIVILPNVIDSSELRRQIVSNKSESQIISTSTLQNNTDVMQPFKREARIRELNISINDRGATYEKSADARNELAYLKDRNPIDLSYDLEQQRRNWKVDLTDFNIQKRTKALSALASIYTNYR